MHSEVVRLAVTSLEDGPEPALSQHLFDGRRGVRTPAGEHPGDHPMPLEPN